MYDILLVGNLRCIFNIKYVDVYVSNVVLFVNIICVNIVMDYSFYMSNAYKVKLLSTDNLFMFRYLMNLVILVL